MSVTTRVHEIEPNWLLICFQGEKPLAARRAFFLHRTIQDWLSDHPGSAIRRTLPILDRGELVACHVWLGDAPAKVERKMPVKIHYQLVDRMPTEHLEALLQHAYEIFFDHEDSGAGALAVISRSGNAVVFDRASQQCFALPVSELGNLAEDARLRIEQWRTEAETNYFVMELGQFKTDDSER